MSDPSKEFTLLVELSSSAASEVFRSRLALQEAERDGVTKTTAMATFVPRCRAIPAFLPMQRSMLVGMHLVPSSFLGRTRSKLDITSSWGNRPRDESERRRIVR